MLKLRPAQMDVLAAQQRQNVARTLGRELHAEYARIFQYYTADQMTHWVFAQLEYLKQQGVNSEYATRGLLRLLCLYGENFARHSESESLLTILKHPSHDQDTKYDLIVHALGKEPNKG